MIAHRASCDCGWTGEYSSANKAAWCLRKHSCERHLAKAASAQRGAERRAAVDRTPKPCHHKEANHQHGTYSCYVLDRCRCQPCASAHRQYEQQRIRQQAYGRWDGLVDAQPSREHIRSLMARGMGLKRIVEVSGIAQGTLWKLLYGKRQADGRKVVTARVRPSTEQRILAVRLHLADGATIGAIGTTRRLQALVAIGWSQSKLAYRLGMRPSNLGMMLNRTTVRTSTAAAVRSLYKELWNAPPPEATHRDRIAASRARRFAAARGWAPPLAWDDDDLDNPDATPQHAPASDSRKRVHVDDIEWLASSGATWHHLSTRLGVTNDAIEKACRRADRIDLIARIARNTAREVAA